MNAFAYIDGFNLYHGALKGTLHKWLNPDMLCKALFPTLNFILIRYFTAIVKPYPHDSQAPFRQQIYLKALKTINNIDVCDKGYYELRKGIYPQFPLVYLNHSKPSLVVQISKAIEKGTDVNIASFLLLDTFQNKFDEAVIISNDADLITPIEMVVTKFNKKVHVVNPHRTKVPNGKLISVASSYQMPITPAILSSCQLPPQVSSTTGAILGKPPTW